MLLPPKRLLMIQLIDYNDDGIVAKSTDTPYILLVDNGMYSIRNEETGVSEYSGNVFLVEVLALMEAFETTFIAYKEAGSVSAMRRNHMIELREKDVPKLNVQH